MSARRGFAVRAQSSVVAGVVALLLVCGAASAQAQGQVPWPSEGPPRPLPARAVSFPPYEMRTLDNGLQVVAVAHHEQPVVSIRLIVRAGAALDPAGKAGLATLTASLLDQGTTRMTASEMNDAIDFIGGGMNAGAGTDLTFANVIVMKDSVEAGMAMLADMARRPAFAQEEVERQRQQMLSSLRVNLEDPEFVADAVFDRLVYGFHPYGQPQSGTPATLASITRADLVAFHQQYFLPNNAILAVVGDITPEEAFASVGRAFGDWTRRDVVRPTPMAPPEPTRRVVVVNKPDAVQTEVRVGHLGVKRNDSDYMALNMALRILGGEGANRLHQVLRTERGLTYGAKADFDTLLDAGDFEASTNTRSEATGEVLRLIVDQFWRLQRERVGERELGGAKDYLMGSFPLTIETPDAIATQVLNVLFYGLSVNELQSFRERVGAVRPDDIERVARYYLRPDRLSVVLVGNAATFVSQLRGLGFNAYEQVEMTDLDLLAADFKRAQGSAAPAGGPRAPRPGQFQYLPADGQGVPRAPAPPTARSSEDARALLGAFIDAKGGIDRLKAVSSLRVTATIEGLGANRRQPAVDAVTTVIYPDRVRIETRGEQGLSVQVYDRGAAWIVDGRGPRDVPARMLVDLEAGLQRDVIGSLVAAYEGRITARRLPKAASAAATGPAPDALELSGPGLEPMVLYADPRTHLIGRQSYVARGMGQGVIEEVFDDYRSVDGLQVAFGATVRVQGEPVLHRRVTDVALNAPVAADAFIRPTP